MLRDIRQRYLNNNDQLKNDKMKINFHYNEKRDNTYIILIFIRHKGCNDKIIKNKKKETNEEKDKRKR